MLEIFKKKLKTTGNYNMQIQHFNKKDEEARLESSSAQ